MFSYCVPGLLILIVFPCSTARAKPPPTPSSHMKEWEDLSLDELDSFIGLRLLMGIDRKPSVRDYWSTSRLRFTPIYSTTMTRDRFVAITESLHFEDNANLSETDKVWKLRSVIDSLNHQCKTVYHPQRDITVDESLWAFRGNLGWVQYNPAKRARFGFKMYKLSASTGLASGYVSAFKVYTGRDGIDRRTPVSQKAVEDLMEQAGLFGLGYTLHIDNWYSSPDLFHYLQARRTNAVGTADMRRKWMPKQADMSLGKERGSTARRSTATGMLCQQWVDKKVVTILSTVHTSKMRHTTNRRGKEVFKPEAVIDYNKGMKGVDLSDQLAQSYPLSRRSPRWYKKLFFYLVDMAVVNAFAIYKVLQGKVSTQKSFRLALIDELLDTGGCRAPTPPTQADLPVPPFGRLTHPVDKIPNGKRRDCYQCKKDSNTRKATRSMCIQCKVNLCTYECFQKFHS